MEECQARLAALRETLEASIAAGGEASESDLDDALAAEAKALADQGFDQRFRAARNRTGNAGYPRLPRNIDTE